MPSSDATHFDEYRVQTLLKHKILEGYLPAYFRAQGSKQRLGYIDAFAGRGYYTKDDGQEALGSPLLALTLLGQDAALASKVLSIFAEPRQDHFADLSARVGAFKPVHPFGTPPQVIREEFVGVIKKLRGVVQTSLIPTFLFVDPCGAKGVDFESIRWVLGQAGSELFLFFNSNALRRVVGDAAEPHNRHILEAYFGSPSAVDGLLKRWQASADPQVRELAILDTFRSALASIQGVRFILPFRVEHAERQDTSHYLIHATKHPLGFRLMKYVMRDYLARHKIAEGEFELRQASYAASADLFAGQDVEADVLAHLKDGPRQVGEYMFVRTEEPTVFWSEGDYKRAILRLEERGRVLVCKDQAGKEPKPATARMRANPKTKEKEVTLGKDLWVVRGS